MNWHALFSDDDHSDWATIHRFHALQTWNRARGIRQKLGLLLATFLWHVMACAMAWRCAQKFGNTVEAESGISRRQQIAEQIRFACFECISPAAYYLFRLYEPRNRERAQRFLHRYESKSPARLFSIISRDPQAVGRSMNDKLRFHDHCVVGGIPTPHIHMWIEDGHIEGAGDLRRLPRADFFVKPRIGKGGNGAALWKRAGREHFVGAVGERIDEETLRQRLLRESHDVPLLLQERVENHPHVAAFAGHTLATARIMTAINESGHPEPVIVVFRMATGHAVVDNFHRGGLAASVDLKTGELGSAVGIDPVAPRTGVHPDTGVSFAGVRLPGWRRALQHVVRAHERFDGRVVLGWDVGFTPNGPTLVEGNCSPGVLMLQCASGEPLGESRLAQLLVYHLRRRARRSAA